MSGNSNLAVMEVGELLQLQRGYDLPLTEMESGNVPVAGSNGIIGYHNVSLCEPPCITVGRSGSVGKVHYYNVPVWPHNTSLFVSDFKGNDPHYLYYLLKLINFDQCCGASVVPSLNRNLVYPLKVSCFRDVASQRRIGKFLSSVDRLIELSRKRIENLEKLAKEIYDYWFVQFDFPDKNGKPYKTSGGKMVYNAELKREIPVGWKVGRLSSIASFVDDGVKSDLIDAFHYVTTDSLLQGKAGRRIVDNLPVTTITLTKFKPLDVLVSNIRVYLKKIWFADCCGGCSHDVLVFRAKVVPSEYLYSFLRKDLFFDYVSSAAKGSKMPRGDKAHIMRMPITIPDNTLLKQFSDIVKEYKGGITCSTKMIDELTQLREFLLPLLMNGQAKLKG